MCYLLAGWGGPSSCLSNTISSVRYFFLSKGAWSAASHWDTAAFVQDSWQSLNGASGWAIHTQYVLLSRLRSSLPNYRRSYLTTQTCWDYCLLWKLKSLLSVVLWCGSISLETSRHSHHMGNKDMFWPFYFNNWARNPIVGIMGFINATYWSWSDSHTPALTRSSSHQEKVMRTKGHIPNSWWELSEP